MIPQFEVTVICEKCSDTINLKLGDTNEYIEMTAKGDLVVNHEYWIQTQHYECPVCRHQVSVSLKQKPVS